MTPSSPLGSRLRRMPKVELHAHLSGSVSQETLRKLNPDFQPFDVKHVLFRFGADDRERDDVQEVVMRDCFRYFDAVGAVVTNLEQLRAITLDLLRDFANDGCVYLELRTTPKAYANSTAAEYVQTVRDCANAVYNKSNHEEDDAEQEAEIDSDEDGQVVSEHIREVDDLQESSTTTSANGRRTRTAASASTPKRNKNGLLVKLLLSIDRGKIFTLADAQRQVQLVKELSWQFRDFVVGLDVCGNPERDSVVDFLLPALVTAKAKRGSVSEGAGDGAYLSVEEEERHSHFAQLPITWHLGEKLSHVGSGEIDAVLDHVQVLNVRRLGHVCFLSSAQKKRILEDPELHPLSAVELCPTSNCVTRCLRSFREHHLPQWWDEHEVDDCDSCWTNPNPANKRKIRLCLCTDDSGLFQCSLSSELAAMGDAFPDLFSMGDLGDALSVYEQLQRNAVGSSFLQAEEKEELLRKHFDNSRGYGPAVVRELPKNGTR